MPDFSSLRGVARAVAPACDHWSLRAVRERTEHLTVRQDVVQAPSQAIDGGVMLTVADRGGIAHVATADLGESGLRAAFERARSLARSVAGAMAFDPRAMPAAGATGRYAGPLERPLPGALSARLDLVAAACRTMAGDDRVVDRIASLACGTTEQLFLGSDGADIAQSFTFTQPSLTAVAAAAGITQTRTSAGQYNGFCQQGGFEVLERSGFMTDGARIAAEAVALALAPNCPAGTMDVLLMPDQMMLQIHESIGHPLELDRILGDERNFAGTSFVTLDMFGHYRYGSPLLNVSHDPGDPVEFASFGFDDEGLASRKVMLIENGVLLRPLGGRTSAARAFADAGLRFDPVATTRACSWNRAPIDRMSNLNVEPGASPLADMIAATELGVMMRTNCSWSIDDSRNKFQFGCEHGQMIRGGKLAEVVRNPNYRGVSATFWRSLAMVGDRGTFERMGTPFCGKGEPMQVIHVGHASPACRFTDVAVFGGGR